MCIYSGLREGAPKRRADRLYIYIVRATGDAFTSTTEANRLGRPSWNSPVPDVNQHGATGLIHVGLHRADPHRYFFACRCVREYCEIPARTEVILTNSSILKNGSTTFVPGARSRRLYFRPRQAKKSFMHQGSK